MTEEQLAQRRPVWIAMAALFLDTDVRHDYASVAAALAASPYSLEELRRILDDEVTPALQSNLLHPAGEWSGFHEDWIVEQVLPRAGKRRWLPNLVSLDEEWAALEVRIRRLRQ